LDADSQSSGRGYQVALLLPTQLGFNFMRWLTISVIFCARWRRWSRSRLVADEPEGKADQDRREDCEPWTLCRVSDGRSRHSKKSLRGLPTNDRRLAAAAQIQRLREVFGHHASSKT